MAHAIKSKDSGALSKPIKIALAVYLTGATILGVAASIVATTFDVVFSDDGAKEFYENEEH